MDESVCPTLGPKDLQVGGAGAPACQPVFSRLLTVVAPNRAASGRATAPDPETEYGIEIPADDDFETLAGFLPFRLGEIPRAGATVEFDGRRYTVLEMERNRISRVRIEKM